MASSRSTLPLNDCALETALSQNKDDDINEREQDDAEYCRTDRLLINT